MEEMTLSEICEKRRKEEIQNMIAKNGSSNIEIPISDLYIMLEATSSLDFEIPGNDDYDYILEKYQYLFDCAD